MFYQQYGKVLDENTPRSQNKFAIFFLFFFFAKKIPTFGSLKCKQKLSTAIRSVIFACKRNNLLYLDRYTHA